MTQQQQTKKEPQSLLQTLTKTKSQIQTETSKSITTLKTLQTQISTLSLFSQNETLDDISTNTIPFLLIEYYLGLCYITLTTSDMKERKCNLNLSKDYFFTFMDKMEYIELFKDGDDADSSAVLQEYHKLLDQQQEEIKYHEISRDEKINRFRKKRAIETKIEYYTSLQERRIRLDIEDHEDVDGYDHESLLRSLNIMLLKEACYSVLDELLQIVREVEMLNMVGEMKLAPKPPQPPMNKPLEVTRINQDPKTGQLIMQKELIKSKVFQPGWNQPTMTLEEFGDREMKAAVQRSHDQKIAEEEAKKAPRRYEQLVKDGLEDDEELVEQSAVVDRRWDDFKEANPRGSGNKMAHRGDRNF